MNRIKLLLPTLALLVLLSPFARANEASDLAYAIKFNEQSQVMQYLAQGIDPNLKDARGWPMIMIAAQRNNLNMVKILLDNGADASATNKDGKTALDVTKSAKVRSAIEFAGPPKRKPSQR